MQNPDRADRSSENFVIGIGASAGGLEAIGSVLSNLPPGLQSSIIIAQHLEPSHESLLHSLLGKHTQRPVVSLENGMRPKPGYVYTTPSNCDIAYSKGSVELIDTPPNGPKPSIDYFFTSLALNKKQYAIGVILSGTGSDGINGLRSIQTNNGITLVQDPNTAAFSQMPEAAIKTGNVDFILPPEEIGKQIQSAINMQEQIGRKAGSDIDFKELREIINLLYEQTGVDLSGYKPTTLYRRISLRALLRGKATIEQYVDYAKDNPGELKNLLQSILISVTSFFRDRETFARVRTLLDDIISRKKPNDTIRIWVPACSTGEEAYSLAILLHDALGSNEKNYKVQILATDIDEESVQYARKGAYPRTVLQENSFASDYSESFTFHDNVVLVKSSIRESILLARHDLLKDTPFLHIDLISCRNLLIYLNSEIQEQLLALFHYCLEPEGVLVLGKSESVTKKNNLFSPIDSSLKIFKRIGKRTGSIPDFLQKHTSLHVNPPVVRRNRQDKSELLKERQFADSMLQLHDLSAVLIDEKGNIRYIRGDVSPYLRFQDGSVRDSLNVINMARKEIRYNLQTMLSKVRNTKSRLLGQKIRVSEKNFDIFVSIQIQPVEDELEQQYLITFSRQDAGKNDGEDTLSSYEEGNEKQRIRQLEDELAITREHLQDMIEELETNSEEMQSLNEELQSANEELQASNEELGTSNEELQASNEELHTVNEELRNKSEELAATMAQLEEGERRYRELVQNASSALIRWKADGTITFFNEYAEKFFDYRQDEIIGKRVSILVPPEDSEGGDLSGLVQQIVKNPEKYQNYVNENICRNGKRVWMTWTNKPIYGEDGSVDEILAVGSDVTALKDQEQIIRSSEKELQLSQKLAGLGSWRLDLATNEVYWSNEMFRMCGFDSSRTPPPFKQHKQIFTPESWQLLSTSLAHTVATGEPYELELETAIADQQQGWMWVRGEAEKNAKGDIVGVWGAAQDITEQKQKEAQIESLSQHRQLALDAAQLGWWQYYPERQLSVWDARYGEIFELSGTGCHIDEIVDSRIHPEDRSPLMEKVERYLRTDDDYVFDAEYRLRCDEGRIKWIQAYGIKTSDQTDPRGESVCMVGTVEDISERKQIELDLVASEKRLRVFIENAPAALVMMDNEMRYLCYSQQWLELFGLNGRDMIGQNHYEVFPEIPEKIRRNHRRVLQGEHLSSKNEKIERKDGVVQIVNWSAIPWKDRDGSIGGLILFIDDITRQKAIEEEKENLVNQLNQAQRMESVGRLAGGVAHEFNNMLSVILGFTEFAMDKVTCSDEIYEDLLEVKNAANRSVDITQQLLTFARKQTAEPQIIDMNDAISGLLKMLQQLIGENIKLTWVPQSQLWRVRIDPGQLNQILANLCINAENAIENIGEILIKTANVVLQEGDIQQDVEPGEYVLLTVTDNGCGMDQEMVEHIFDPFYTTKDVGEGSGLGLSTVYGIVQQNKGIITVETGVGEGTAFFIYLPRTVAIDQKVQPEKKTGKKSQRKGGEAILLVEDEASIVKVTTKILQTLGYVVQPFSNPYDALHFIKNENQEINLLLTDIIMPDMNGRDLAEKAAAILPDIKVLFMSGYPDTIIDKNLVCGENVSFLAKPFTSSEMSRKIRDILDA